jgi:hypothetical protein
MVPRKSRGSLKEPPPIPDPAGNFAPGIGLECSPGRTDGGGSGRELSLLLIRRAGRGVRSVTTGRLATFWRAIDPLDYWLMQARLWIVDAVCGPFQTVTRPTDRGSAHRRR